MKYLFAVLLALLFAGCAKKTTIDFTGAATDIKEGQFVIKDQEGKVFCQAPIKDGQFAVSREIKDSDYYLLDLTNNLGTQTFEVYLEPGTYSITVDGKKFYQYPTIQSSSETQKELSAYYQLQQNVNDELFKKAQLLNNQLKDAKAKLQPPAAYADLAARSKAADSLASRSGSIVLTRFVAQYPDSKITPHMMIHMSIQADTATYNKVYQKLSEAVKKSSKGQLVRYYLDHPLKAAEE